MAALVAVALCLGAGSVALVLTLHNSFRNNVVADATAEANDIGQVVSNGKVPARLPVRSGLATQVVNASGQVLGASPDLAGRQAVAQVRPPAGHEAVISSPGLLPGDDDADVAVALTVPSRRGPVTVYAVASVEQIERSTRWLIVALGIAVPVLVALSGVLAWTLAGRALAPVEEIRREVAHISAHQLSRRVPEPPDDDEVGRLARTMNAMLGRLEAFTARQRQFVSDASHELRSPLGGLLAQIEVARAHPERADWPAVAEAVADEGSRLWSIVDDLLLLAKADEGYLNPRREPVDLDELIFDEVARLRSRGRVEADARHVGAGRVVGDRAQLERVLRNLVDNAERYATSRVSFSLRPLGGLIELIVADDGPGIPAEERQRIFDRFARVGSSRTRHEGGTGLGLAIVGQVVAAHSGTVKVGDSERGTRMEVLLPATGP